MYVSHIIAKALSEVSKSLDDNFPSCIDYCDADYRFIVEFLGNNDNVQVLNAEVLDADWLLLEEMTILFSEKVNQMVEAHNSEYNYYKEQSIEIRRDRLNEC